MRSYVFSACPFVSRCLVETPPGCRRPRGRRGARTASPARRVPAVTQGRGCAPTGPSSRMAVYECVLKNSCLVLLPVPNFSPLKGKEMCLRSVRELTASHSQQNSRRSPGRRIGHQLTGYQGGFGTLFPWSRCFLSLACSDYAKNNCSCSLGTSVWP